jgi:hypothetical protein
MSVIEIDKLVAEEELVPLLTCDLYDCGNLNDFEFPLLSFREIIPSLGFMSVDCRNIVGKKNVGNMRILAWECWLGVAVFLSLHKFVDEADFHPQVGRTSPLGLSSQLCLENKSSGTKLCSGFQTS